LLEARSIAIEVVAPGVELDRADDEVGVFETFELTIDSSPGGVTPFSEFVCRERLPSGTDKYLTGTRIGQ
jgi:hypothetical protein